MNLKKAKDSKSVESIMTQVEVNKPEDIDTMSDEEYQEYINEIMKDQE